MQKTMHPDVESQTKRCIRKVQPQSADEIKLGEEVFNNDVERLPNDGYHWIARHMAKEKSPHPIFRKFGELNMLNLLCLQAELMQLRGYLEYLCKAKIEAQSEPADGNNNTTSRSYPFNFAKIEQDYQQVTSGKDGDVIGSQQWETLLSIRTRLKEYNEALLQVAQINGLERPEKRDLRIFRHWIVRSPLKRGSLDYQHPGTKFTTKAMFTGGRWKLEGSEAYTWGDEDDLISLQKLEDKDPFQRLLSGYALDFYHWVCSRWEREDNDGLVVYTTRFGEISASIAAIAAAILPILSILALYFIKSTLKRIYTLIGLTVLFAALTKLFTCASNVEIFAATAAFAAVEVVFVGNPMP